MFFDCNLGIFFVCLVTNFLIMENRDITDNNNKCYIKGVRSTYIGYKIENRTLRSNNYTINRPFICIIASTTLINSSNIGLDYLYINVFTDIVELLAIDVTVIQNPFFIFIPFEENVDEIKLIIEDIKQQHPNYGFNEEPFCNSL